MAQGSTIHKHFSRGYQEALADVLEKFMTDGQAGALRWIEDNTRDAPVREAAQALRDSLETEGE